jgi:hypothetical protein
MALWALVQITLYCKVNGVNLSSAFPEAWGVQTITDTARHFIMFDDPQWFFAELDLFLGNPDLVVRTRGFER